MTFFHTFLLLLAAAVPAAPGDQPFRLEPGDFRWTTFTVRHYPLGIDGSFRVLDGNPTVHLELLAMGEFRRFTHGGEYSAMALTPDARKGEFRRVVEEPGQYAVVIVNQRNARAATVTLHVATTLNPAPGDIASTLSGRRRFAVVAISLAFFLISISWSGHRLIQAMRRNRPEL